MPEPAIHPTVGTGLVRELFNFIVARGADRTALCARVDILAEELDDSDGRVPLSKYLTLLAVGAELTADPALALHFGAEVDMSQISVLGLLTHASETMAEAMAQINRYGRLVIDGGEDAEDRFLPQRRFDKLWLVDTWPRPTQLSSITEVTFAQLVCGTRRIGIDGWLKAVHVTHPAPSYAGEYEKVFDAPVVFDRDWNALELDEAYVEHRVAAAPRYVFGILSKHAQAMLQALERTKSTRGRVERLLMPILHTGEASVAQIADRMDLNRQALYRKLKAEGVTFERTLDELRHRLALHYLSDGVVSVKEVAYLLGFSAPGAFSRFFKRWTGTRPGHFRDSVRN